MVYATPAVTYRAVNAEAGGVKDHRARYAFVVGARFQRRSWLPACDEGRGREPPKRLEPIDPEPAWLDQPAHNSESLGGGTC